MRPTLLVFALPEGTGSGVSGIAQFPGRFEDTGAGLPADRSFYR